MGPFVRWNTGHQVWGGDLSFIFDLLIWETLGRFRWRCLQRVEGRPVLGKHDSSSNRVDSGSSPQKWGLKPLPRTRL